MIYLLLGLQVIHIFIRKIVFGKNHYILGFLQILKLKTKLINLVSKLKQLLFLNKTQYLMVIKIKSELEDVLERGFYESPLGYNIIDWFMDEVLQLEKNGILF